MILALDKGAVKELLQLLLRFCLASLLSVLIVTISFLQNSISTIVALAAIDPTSSYLVSTTSKKHSNYR